MRVFIFAVITLTVSFFLMFFTQFYVSGVISKLENIINTFPTYYTSNEKASEDTLRCLDDSVDFWQCRRFTVCLLINRDEFEEIENLLLSIRAAVHSSDNGIYASSLASLKERLTRLKKSESLSLDGIL